MNSTTLAIGEKLVINNEQQLDLILNQRLQRIIKELLHVSSEVKVTQYKRAVEVTAISSKELYHDLFNLIVKTPELFDLKITPENNVNRISLILIEKSL